MKLIVLIGIILLNSILCEVAIKRRIENEEENPEKDMKILNAGKNYKGIKESSTEYYQNEFFEKCKIKSGKLHKKSNEISYKCKDSSGKKKKFKAKLRDCLRAESGRLFPKWGFPKNTKKCKVKKNILKCKVIDGNGKWHKAKFNMNYIMYFMKDKLICKRGTRPWFKKP